MKFIKIVGTIVLVLLPIIGSVHILARFSPVDESNSMLMYILICLGFGLVMTMIMKWLAQGKSKNHVLQGGIILFFLGPVISSVLGLGAPPDFSIDGLKHLSIEHFRYALLLVNVFLAVGGFYFISKNYWTEMKHFSKYLFIVFAFLGLGEMIWEFYRHYFYLDELEKWMATGKSFDAFNKAYFDTYIVKIMGLCRSYLFIAIIWFGTVLVRYKAIYRWALYPIGLLSLLGIMAGVTVLILGEHAFGKLQILNLIIIPAGPFILMYFLSLSIICKKDTPAVISQVSEF